MSGVSFIERGYGSYTTSSVDTLYAKASQWGEKAECQAAKDVR